MSATADVESMEQTGPAGSAAAAAGEGDRSQLTAADEQAEQLQLPPGLAPVAGAALRPSSSSLEQLQQSEPSPEPVPAPEPTTDDEGDDEAIAAAVVTAEATDVATTTPAAGEIAVAGSAAAGEAAGAATGEMGAGMAAMDARRAEPMGAGKRQAVPVARVQHAVCIDDDEEDAAASGASSWASEDAPSRARAGVQCKGLCAGGRQCEVRSVGSSAPTWVSAPLRAGGQFCTTHAPHRVAARVAKAAAKAAAAQRQWAAAQGVQRAGAARRAASANRSTAGMAATIMAAARGK